MKTSVTEHRLRIDWLVALALGFTWLNGGANFLAFKVVGVARHLFGSATIHGSGLGAAADRGTAYPQAQCSDFPSVRGSRTDGRDYADGRTDGDALGCSLPPGWRCVGIRFSSSVVPGTVHMAPGSSATW
ncbi:MAG: hypothetical protein V7K20_15530 [Nostoc sp.]